MRRVADEIAEQSAPLAEELVLTTAELSFLPTAHRARQSGTRTGLEDVRAVVQALIQADLRFGTPIANALRAGPGKSRPRMNAA